MSDTSGDSKTKAIMGDIRNNDYKLISIVTGTIIEMLKFIGKLGYTSFQILSTSFQNIDQLSPLQLHGVPFDDNAGEEKWYLERNGDSREVQIARYQVDLSRIFSLVASSSILSPA